MTKKELNRAKRALKSESETVDRIAACYVGPEKSLFPQEPVFYPAMPSEEGERYLELFRKVLTGTQGKTLHDVEFSQEAEGEGTGHELLYNVLQSGLQDPEKNELLFRRIADAYEVSDPYCILLLSASVSLPSGRNEDVMGDFDAEDNVYRYLLTAVCPVKEAKPALTYSHSQHRIENAVCGRLLSPPSFGLLFPALTDGTPDLHAMVCQTRKQSESEETLVSEAFQCALPKSAEAVQDGFALMLQESLGSACTFENIACVENRLLDLAEQQREEDPDRSPTVDGKHFAALVRETAEGTPAPDIESVYQNYFGGEEIRIDQAVPQRTVVKDPEFSLTCSAEEAGRVKITRVDGKMCVVLPLSGEAEVNGIPLES